MSKEKLNAGKGRKSSKGASGGGSSTRWLYAIVALIVAGLAWIVWPFFSPVAPAPDTTRQLKELSRNPDAEVLNPDGLGSKKN